MVGAGGAREHICNAQLKSTTAQYTTYARILQKTLNLAIVSAWLHREHGDGKRRSLLCLAPHDFSWALIRDAGAFCSVTLRAPARSRGRARPSACGTH